MSIYRRFVHIPLTVALLSSPSAFAEESVSLIYSASFSYGDFGYGSCETIYRSAALDDAEQLCVDKGYRRLYNGWVKRCDHNWFLGFSWVSVKVQYRCY